VRRGQSGEQGIVGFQDITQEGEQFGDESSALVAAAAVIGDEIERRLDGLAFGNVDEGGAQQALMLVGQAG
jgi:hypothetical protein